MSPNTLVDATLGYTTVLGSCAFLSLSFPSHLRSWSGLKARGVNLRMPNERSPGRSRTGPEEEADDDKQVDAGGAGISGRFDKT
ncbi:hypothetical protein CH63R_05838 [Colletotrichum higginsianum IMI 349063]|uniref:Uncharacterized protein n=1 Tax=Colletotrichum higginsianum (strain IMI 349063) TaxID=759273 RepID=A0A1B7YDI2_COLHI|nr:hypothetical protein CH63R_05838 [Colletotrichum higginsianum IMI 349063]OBR10146.1 hypothetical protein CH63R_05838 [Colletotrichum higginsianum IMI 349063]